VAEIEDACVVGVAELEDVAEPADGACAADDARVATEVIGLGDASS
jgi:hypothetical protein